jgi:sodium-dependent dicarboxylate transporter 2/3/5
LLDGKSISNTYNYVIFLFIGGFFYGISTWKMDLHKRLALRILSHLGGSPFKIWWFYVGFCFFIHVDV